MSFSVDDGQVDAGSRLNVRKTESALERMRGLLGHPPLSPNEALVIEPCNMVHTLGMAYPIDVVFTDRRGVVIAVHAVVAPARMRACLRARAAVELRAGEAARRGWVAGSVLSFLVPEAVAT